MNDQQLHTFERGLNFDTDPSKIPSNQYTDAENVEMVSDEAGGLFGIEPIAESDLMLTVPNVPVQTQVDRIECDFGTSHVYLLYFSIDYFGSPIIASTTVTTNSFAAFSSSIAAQLLVFGYTATITRPDAGAFPNVVQIELVDGSALPVSFSLIYKIDGVETKVNTRRDAFSQEYECKPICSYELQTNEFVLSRITNNTGAENKGLQLGVVKLVSGIRTYVKLLTTNKLFLSEDVPVDMRVSVINGNNYSVNYVYQGEKPRVIYVPDQLTNDCAIQYANPLIKGDGYQNLASIVQQSSLQLINNIGRIKFSTQSQTGGNLESGGYRYFVRFGLNATRNVTEWSLGSGLVPVYKADYTKSNSWLQVQGDPSGTQTSKYNTLLIEGVQPNVFDYIEVAVVQYSGTSGSDVVATEAYIIGRQDVTTTTTTFSHYGNEITQETITVAELVPVDNVILSASSQEIKKNRLNLSDVQVGVTDETYRDFIDGITVGTNRFNVGDQGSVIAATNNYVSAVFEYFYNQADPGGLLTLSTESYDPYAAYNTGTQVFTANASDTFTINFNIGIGLVFGINASYNYKIIYNDVSAGTSTVLYELSQPTAILSPGNSNFIGNASVFMDVGDTISIYTFTYSTTTTPFQITVANAFQILRGSDSDFSDTVSNGYMLPENCANKAGYMIRETYPLYAALHLTNGYITDPIFLGYHNMSYDFANSLGAALYHNYGGEVYNYNFVLNNLNIGSIRDTVKGISIWRGDSPPTVISTGLYCLADGATPTEVTFGYYPSLPTFNVKGYYNHYGFLEGIRKFGVFMSPETERDKAELQTGNYFVSYGTLTPYFNQVYINQDRYSQAVEYRSYSMELGTMTTTIRDSEFVPFNSMGKTWLTNAPGSRRKAALNYENIAASQAQALAMSTEDIIKDQGTATTKADCGAYITQLWNTDPNTPVVAGDPNNYKLIYTGTFIEITPETPDLLGNVQVYGGDTYTVKQIQKLAYGSKRYNVNNIYSSFITYYTQSRINTDLNYNNTESDNATWTLKGFASVINYLQQYATIPQQEQWNNDPAYWAQNKINYVNPYNSNIKQVGYFPARIYYSEQRTEGGLYDFYRKILPLSFKDLDAKYGRIVELKDVTDKMVAWQEDAVSVLPYQSNIAINTDSTQTYVGTGGVYEQQQNVVSTIGAKFKSNVLIARNNAGNNIGYWYSDARRSFNRYSHDGVKILSDENTARSYFLSNVFDGVENEYDVTFGFSPAKNSIYITRSGVKTLVWSEKFNCFSSKASFLPKRYFTLDTMVICPNVVSPYGRLYDMFPTNPSGYLSWFGGEQTGDFMIEVSTNKGTYTDKRYYATSIVTQPDFDTADAPTLVVSNVTQSATTLPSEFELRNSYLAGAVRYDSNNPIISTFAKYKFTFQAYCKITGIINKFRIKSPNPFDFR